MTRTRDGRAVRNWPWSEWWLWAVAIFVVVAFSFPLLTYRVGRCVDYMEGYGESTCWVESPLGPEATWGLGIAAAIAGLYFAYRLVLALLSRRV
ncbi:hypothetical protein [Arthrobacter oryzae]|uniref:hypothetical protein n=1 Tax=Arthrobacter oryzae TaxID=409290 RepID=UPI0030C9D43A